MSSSASRTGTDGSLSEGFRMKALPHGDGEREHPHRDHGREIERGDAGHDAQGLAHRIDVDAGAGAFGVFALQQMRDAAGELDHFQAALDVAFGVGDHLAMLGGEQVRPARPYAPRPGA